MDLDAQALRALIDEGEGTKLEFKRGLPRPERVARTLCAFANTKGGVLVVGVTDRGEPWGVPDPAGVAQRLRAVAQEVLSPPVHIEARMLRLDGCSVVVASIPASRSRPHAVHRANAEPEIVVRLGSSNRVAAGATLAALRRPRVARAGLGALEKDVLEWVRQRSKKSARPDGDATIRGFAQARNVGVQRARRAFQHLENEGFLVGHGRGAQRIYAVV